MLAIPDARSVGIEQAAALANQIEAWADTTDDLDALEDARAKVAAIETYLRHRHEAASTEIARADRRLEIRIGQLLPEPLRGGDRRSTDFSSLADELKPAGLTPNQRSQFRKMASVEDEPEIVDAVEAGASRAEVLREANRIIKAKTGETPTSTRESRQRAEFNLLCQGIVALPAGPEFLALHRDHLTDADVADAEAARHWLGVFLRGWKDR